MPSFIEALVKPDFYPHRPRKVELIQTQMSLVFLTGEYVYKVKKPVNLGYLDYTTLEKRHFFCRQELELNRRLCPDVYLAVLPITASLRRATRRSNLVELEGKGKIVEYAVKMKQLPRDRMMDALLARGQVSQEMAARAAGRLADFHGKAEANQKIAAFGKLDVIGCNCDENFAQTEKYIGVTIPGAIYERIRGYMDDFIRGNAGLFDKRVTGGRIRDCHGDLHAAHVCFTDDPRLSSPGGQVCIYDCIEFNDRFRYCDVASEVAFLAMDLDRYQQVDLSRHLVDTYVALSCDEELLGLLDFYKCYRAYVRGKVESFKLDDALISENEKEKALESARGYFQLAESYL